MLFEQKIKEAIIKCIGEKFNIALPENKIVLQPTRKEFSGDVALVTFGIAPLLKETPENAGKIIGTLLQEQNEWITSFETVKGFLNITIDATLYMHELNSDELLIEKNNVDVNPVVVEYSSPNTNKPLHLGHIRNNLLGFSLAKIIEAAGNKVAKVNIVNDRGIHICKSMLAWQLFGNGETPQSSGLKGDKLVGKYYVEFDKKYNEEARQLLHQWNENKFDNSNNSIDVKTKVELLKQNIVNATKPEAKEKAETELKDFAKANTTIFKQVQQMLRAWEAGDEATIALWKTMNGWVYDGFAITYKNLGVDFEKIYYESETYLLGKKIVEEGLQKNIFYKKDDGSVWIDLTDEGLDHKLLLRGDGTSVYITQDLGTAYLRYDDFQFSRMIYVVGNEQDYHFKVLKLILKKIGVQWWNRLQHFNYNMVDLPTGKMKSREGTVVDADDLIEETITNAQNMTRELGKLEGVDDATAKQLFFDIGMGALKFYILKVDPEKRMLFNPEESIDINGCTGPFVQYTYARIQSLRRKALSSNSLKEYANMPWQQHMPDAKELELIKQVISYKETVMLAAEKLSPAIVANYAYETAKIFNQFYHDHVAVDEQNIQTSAFRILLSTKTSNVLKHAFGLLGINMPERM